MAESGGWLTPEEVARALGDKKSMDILNELVYNKRTRRELLDEVMKISNCNEYSADDFLRELVKNPPK